MEGAIDQRRDQIRYHTANFYPMKTTGTGNCGVPAGKTCTIYGKGLYRLQGNPMIIITVLFWSTGLLILRKNSPLHVYSILHVYWYWYVQISLMIQYEVVIDPIMF